MKKLEKITYNELMSFISKFERKTPNKIILPIEAEKILLYSRIKKVPYRIIVDLLNKAGYNYKIQFIKKYYSAEIKNNKEKYDNLIKELKKEKYL